MPAQATTIASLVESPLAANSQISQVGGAASPPPSPLTASAKSGIAQCPEPLTRWYCLNGGTCFSVKIQESVLHNCWCPIGFNGLRCEFKYTKVRDSELPTEINQTASEPTKGLDQTGSRKWSPLKQERECRSDVSCAAYWHPDLTQTNGGTLSVVPINQVQPSRVQLQAHPTQTFKQRDRTRDSHEDIYLFVIYIFSVLLLIILAIIIIQR